MWERVRRRALDAQRSAPPNARGYAEGRTLPAIFASDLARKPEDRGRARSHQTSRKQLILLVDDFFDPLTLSKASDALSGRVVEGRHVQQEG
jgi:hypothetical protein